MVGSSLAAHISHPGGYQGNEKKFLIAFDFDYTIIDANSDVEIQKMHISGPIPERLKVVAKEQGWTMYMQEVFRYHYTNDVTEADFDRVIHYLPFVSGIKECFHEIHALGGELERIAIRNGWPV